MPEFEKSEGCNTHEILSDNRLCCAETGRVVAVFYNEYDLDNVMKALKENKNLKAQTEALEEMLSECTSHGELDSRLFNSFMEHAIERESTTTTG